MALKNDQTPEQYDKYYENPQAWRENAEIASILQHLNNKTVLDLGCGTGLARTLFHPKAYWGVDINEKSLEHAKNKNKNSPDTQWHHSDAHTELRHITPENIISLFALDDIGPEIIPKIAKRTGTIILVHHNQPWMSGSASEYQDQPEKFGQDHPPTKQAKTLELLRQHGFYTRPLLGEPYYWISTRGPIDKNRQKTGGE